MSTTSPDITFERGLPANADAEKMILGAILLDNGAYLEAAALLGPDDFALDAHQRIFARMGDLLNGKHLVDIVTLTEALSQRKEVEAVGGVAYLASLIEGLPYRLSIQEHVRIVRDKSLLRRMINIHSAAINRAADQADSAEAILSTTRAEMDALNADAGQEGLQLAGEYLRIEFPTADSMMERAARSQGVPTGIDGFDKLTAGLQQKELIVVAARPSMGKSDFAINIAEHASVNLGRKVALFLPEMSKEQVLVRMICARARVDRKAFKDGHLSSEDRRYFADVREEILDAPLYLDDSSEMTVSHIRHQALWLQAKAGLDLAVVDYLQLLSAGDILKHYSREQDVANMSRRMKLLAKDLGVPVVMLAQLSRENSKRTDKRPILSDLRESGAIEQDADLVAFLHRECYYEPDNDDLKGKGEIIIAKQRNGPVGTVSTGYDPSLGRWGDVPVTAETEFAW